MITSEQLAEWKELLELSKGGQLAGAYVVAYQALPKLIEEVERLREALELTRGQWIHSVNASTCLEALGEKNET